MRLHPKIRRMRSLALVAVCSAAFGSMTLAAQDNGAPPPPPAAQDNQGPPPPPPPGEGRPDPAQMQARHLEMMTKRLNLTPDQVSQVKAIQDDGMNQMQALRSDTSTPREEKRAKMQSIHQAQTEKVRAVLNDEQKAKFDAMEAKRRSRMHGHGGDMGGQETPPPPPQP